MRDLLTDVESDILSDPDPVRRAQNQMRRDLPKRFYKDVTVVPVEHGDETVFEVHLDGRPARTPSREHLRLPTRAVAQMIADEYAAQETVIDPVTMPVARIANTAIDGVLRDPEPVFDDVLKFAGSDLLCYRADSPEGLVARQAEAWNPVLDWIAKAIGERFAVTEGVVHVTQPTETLAALRKYMLEREAGPFDLTCLHLLTSLSGSALLALAVRSGRLSPDEAWKAAHIDEDWQVEHWGQDSEAVARRNARRRDFDAAARMIEAL